jgi:hypothetical protein
MLMPDDGEDEFLWWGKPFEANRHHIFEGKGALCLSLCSSGWGLNYDGEDPEVDPEEDGFTEGQDCKACSRKAGVLDDG